MAEPKPSVLLVDDVEANLIALEASLADMDCELVRASSGNDALRLLLKREFALVLLDVQMPSMDGYEVAKYSRENPATKDIPIIFITAMNETDENTLRGYKTGAVDLLFKPISPFVLRSKVRVFLDLHLSQRRLSEQIDAHRRTMAELELANRALHHFTNAASHDLNAPLRAITGFLEALDREVGTRLDERARHYLDRSRQASVRMASLLEALLAYARLQKPVYLAEVDCESLLSQVQSDLAEQLNAARASIIVRSLPKVRGDSDRLYQLFLNLIRNAVKFQRAGTTPQITVSAETRGKTATFCVADNGIGIDASDHATVFEAFRRLNRPSEYEGSGLGLTICQQIVEQHGGRLWVESEAGNGSRFYFTLPCADPITTNVVTA